MPDLPPAPRGRGLSALALLLLLAQAVVDAVSAMLAVLVGGVSSRPRTALALLVGLVAAQAVVLLGSLLLAVRAARRPAWAGAVPALWPAVGLVVVLTAGFVCLRVLLSLGHVTAP